MTKRIAIVNRTNLKNYGSVLQVLALCKAVEKLGYDSEVVWQRGNMSKNFDIRPNKVLKTGLKLICHPSLLWTIIKTMRVVKTVIIDDEKVKRFNDFVKKNFSISLYNPNKIRSVAKTDKYYKFVCGSDQVWSTTTLYPDPMMYLRFSPKQKRVAYAPSLGRDYIPRYNKRILKKYINDIPVVSVREDKGKELIKQLTGRDVPVVADPTLLVSSQEWDKLKTKIELLPPNYVLCYFLDEPSVEVKSAICNYAKSYNKYIVALGMLGNIDYPVDKIFEPIAGPAEFLTITSNADAVITDSYHGMLFAINYHRKFWSVERAYSQYDQSSRQLSVLSILGLEKRYVKNNLMFTDSPIDYTAVQTKIDDFVNASMRYLDDALKY